MTVEKLKEQLEAHERWLRGDARGKHLNLRGEELQYVFFKEANLKAACLQGANLQNANLCNAELARVDAKEANFSGADLNKANLSEANLNKANFRGADLRKANFKDAELEGADFRGAKIEGICLSLNDSISKINMDAEQIKYLKQIVTNIAGYASAVAIEECMKSKEAK